jgi:hypothetical protein
MSIKVSIGVAEGELDWELLEECRSDARSSVPDDELDAVVGWPSPAQRGDDEIDAALQAWAW